MTTNSFLALAELKILSVLQVFYGLKATTTMSPRVKVWV